MGQHTDQIRTDDLDTTGEHSTHLFLRRAQGQLGTSMDQVGHSLSLTQVDTAIQESATRAYEQTLSMNVKAGGTYTVKFTADAQTQVTAVDSMFNRTTTTIKARYWVEDNKTGETVSH